MNILTTGVFDLGMHAGHVMFLLECAKFKLPGGKLIVGVNTDYSAAEYKRKPIFDLNERIFSVGQLPFVDEVQFINSEEDICMLIVSKKIDVYIKGAEWAGKEVTGQDLCTVAFLQPIKSFHSNKLSTSTIIQRIHERYKTDQANNH